MGVEMTWDDDIYTCQSCDRDDLVLASGPRGAKILIIGESPGDEEIKKGKPMVGAMGHVLRTELARVNLDVNQMRLTNLWLHPKNDNEKCFKHGLDAVIKEARNRKAILLLGSDTVAFFCNQKVSEVNGLVVESSYFSVPLLFACVQPATVFHAGLGEVRLSLSKFSRKLEGL
jgi:uracil-DNA glycosylase family 4